MEPVLSVRNLKTHFFTEEGTVRAVDGLSYDLYPGQTLGIVGESGCGKSVHALSILRLIPDPPGKIVNGEIWFKGKNAAGPVDILKLPGKKMRQIRGNRIAMIFQEPMTSLNPVLTVGEQIAEVLRQHEGAGAGAAWQEAVNLLDKVGIPQAAKRVHDYPHSFSGGMRQRAMIAMALAMKPDILIADEPTTALDVTIQAQILNLMREMQKAYQMSLIMITHNLGVVAEICDDIIVMYAGKPVEKAGVAQLFNTPRHPYTWGLLNSVPKLNRQVEHLAAIEGQPPNLAHLPKGCSFTPRCPYAWEKCRSEEPPLEITQEGQAASCWLHHNEAAAIPQENLKKARGNKILVA
ncbi:MAG: ABC transporter ATP-binding protein [Elusimicrobia bacterium]|nr:ABC transporter ATP-binding protein [Elusimicrobiota bacterium]